MKMLPDIADHGVVDMNEFGTIMPFSGRIPWGLREEALVLRRALLKKLIAELGT